MKRSYILIAKWKKKKEQMKTRKIDLKIKKKIPDRAQFEDIIYMLPD